MGNQPLRQYEFLREEWQLVEKNQSTTLWKNRHNPSIMIEQYDVFAKDDDDFERQKTAFQFRFKHQQLVAGIYFEEQSERDYCSTNHKYSVFIEKIPIRLVDIQRTPFPDCLHLYFQALTGFQQLSQRYGCFCVDEDFIGINEKGIVKVWMNENFSESYIIGGKINQEQMVKTIIDTLDSNCDLDSLGSFPTVRNYLYRNSDTLRFDQALHQFKQYVFSYNNGRIPSRLECIERVGGINAIVNKEYPTESNIASRNLYVEKSRQNSQPYLLPEQGPHYQIISPPPSQHNISSPGPALQYGLKGSDALPNARRQENIIDPRAARGNVEVIRRKSGYENANQHFGRVQVNQMKFSQIIPQPVKHNWQTTNNKPEGKIFFTVPSQKNPNSAYIPSAPQTPQAQSYQKPAIIIKAPSAPAPPLYPQPKPYQQYAFPEVQNQITFKSLGFRAPQNKPQPLNNASIANFSLGPSQTPSQRVTVRTSLGESRQKEKEINLVRQSQQVQPAVTPYRESHQKSSSELVRPVSIRQERPTNKIQPQIQRKASTKKIQEIEISHKTNKVEGDSYSGFNFTKTEASYKAQTEQFSKPVPKNSNQFTIDANDGKSSEQFLRQLRQIKEGIKQSNTYESPKAESPFKQSYSGTYNYSKPNFSPSTGSYFHPTWNNDPIVPSNATVDDEDFGRNTTSNIIDVEPTPAPHTFRNNEPLKFEKDLEMKYSVLQPDEQSVNPHYKYL